MYIPFFSFFCIRKYMFMFVFRFSCYKLVAKPQNIRIPSQGSAMVGMSSPPMLHAFLNKVPVFGFTNPETWTPVISASLVVILNRSRSFNKPQGDMQIPLPFIFHFFHKSSNSSALLFIFTVAVQASRSQTLSFYLEGCTK